MKQKKGVEGQLDKAWSLLVKLNAGMKCEYCGKTTYLNSHHIYSRSKMSVRWDERNGISLCSGHHTLISTFSAHKTPLDFIDWLVKYKGNKFIDELRTIANTHYKWTKTEKEELLKELQKKICELQ